jgi:hypothetical protein
MAGIPAGGSLDRWTIGDGRRAVKNEIIRNIYDEPERAGGRPAMSRVPRALPPVTA